jgi:hypothetical protein
VKLDGGEPDLSGDFRQILIRPIHKDTHLLNLFRQFSDYRARRIKVNPARAFLVENKPQGIRAGFDRRQRVFQIRDAANLDPSHGQE